MTFPNTDANARSTPTFFLRLAFHLGSGALGVLFTVPFGVRCFAQSLVPEMQVQTEAVPPLALPPVLANEPEGRLAVSAAEAVGLASPSTPVLSESQNPLREEKTRPVLPISPEASKEASVLPSLGTSEGSEMKAAAEAVELKDSTTSPAKEIPSPVPPENAGGIDFNPWQSLGLVGGMLVFLAAGGIFLVRFKNRGLFPVSKQEKLMEIVGTLALAPKRSVVLVRIKGEEFAIASTEQGITFLKTIGTQAGDLKSTVSAGEPSLLSLSRPEPRRFARESTPRLATPPNSSASSQEFPVEPDNAQGKEPSGANPKSELLLSALRNMRGKNPKEAAVKESTTQNAKTSAFPRYLANAFAEESRRELKGQAAEEQQPTPSRSQARKTTTEAARSEEHQMESVTSLIREKLREMKPLA